MRLWRCVGEDSMDEALRLPKRCARQAKHTPANQTRTHVMKPIGLHVELQAQEQLDHHHHPRETTITIRCGLYTAILILVGAGIGSQTTVV